MAISANTRRVVLQDGGQRPLRWSFREIAYVSVFLPGESKVGILESWCFGSLDHRLRRVLTSILCVIHVRFYHCLGADPGNFDKVAQ